MDRSTGMGLLGLSLFLLLFPLTLPKPGLPQGLKADEAAYYMMATSLAYDRDLRLDVEDTERLFRDFPFRAARNLIVMTDDDWETAHYSKPLAHALFAAPFVRVFGANGLLFFNMALLVAMIWMGFLYLERFNPEPVAALFSAGFFVVSAIFSYAFWLQPEMLSMFGVTSALFLGLDRESPDRDWQNRPGFAIFASGMALALPVYNKPMFLGMALPLLIVPILERNWRIVSTWLSGFVLVFGGLCGLGILLTGHASPYLGKMQRTGVRVCEPGVLPTEALAAAARRDAARAEAVAASATNEEVSTEPTIDATQAAAAEAEAAGHSPRTFGWLFRIPEFKPGELFDNVRYFLWGRHTGLLVYFPFTGLSLFLFLANGRESLRRWALLFALMATALYFLLWIYWNWQGGGGFVANRYYLNVVPGFLFLVTRITPTFVPVIGYALGGLFIGQLLLTPFGSMSPEPTLQAHARSAPLRWLPLELTLRNLPGYYIERVGDLRVRARKDQIVPRGDTLWVAGSGRVRLLISSLEPLERPVLLLRDVAPGASLDVRLGRDKKRVSFSEPGEALRLEMAPRKPDKVRFHEGIKLYYYELDIEADRGHVETWTRHFPPNACSYYFAYNETVEESFYKGAEVVFLGDASTVDAPVFRVEWGGADVPTEVSPGERFTVSAFLYNRSQVPWAASGAARVKLSYHWRTTGGREVVRDGLRSPLPGEVAPNVRTPVSIEVEAPREPGSYVLELDPVLEHVAWFSDRRNGRTFRHPVEVR
ncbi:MAG: hypothetical protein AAF690_03435 [Acidobacteriota bacterium]